MRKHTKNGKPELTPLDQEQLKKVRGGGDETTLTGTLVDKHAQTTGSTP